MKAILKFLYICVGIVFVALLYPHNTAKDSYTVVSATEELLPQDDTVAAETALDWGKFIDAVIWKESRGNENAVGDNGNAIGVLQIHPIMVREANRILKILGINKEYSYEDRYIREKSVEIFNIIQDFHNKTHDFERALQIWNKNHPDSYRAQIMEKYNELISI